MSNENQTSNKQTGTTADGDPIFTEHNVIALPKTVGELMEQRKTHTQKTLNDRVEGHHLSLWETEKYQKLLDAVYVEQAVEGSLIADDFEAARMIREAAHAAGDKYVSKQKLDTIRKSLNVVLRRYGVSRLERRNG